MRCSRNLVAARDCGEPNGKSAGLGSVALWIRPFSLLLKGLAIIRPSSTVSIRCTQGVFEPCWQGGLSRIRFHLLSCHAFKKVIQIDALAAVHPLATSVYLGVSGHGTHYRRRTGLDLSSLLNDSLQSRTHISSTLGH